MSVFLVLMAVLQSCRNDDPPVTPGTRDFTLEFSVASENIRYEAPALIFRSRMKLSGNLPEILEKGISYSTQTTPTASSLIFRPVAGQPDSLFEGSLTGVDWTQTWRIRAYAITRTRTATPRIDTTFGPVFSLQALHSPKGIVFSGVLPDRIEASWQGLKANVIPGLGSVLAKGFCWSESPLPYPAAGNSVWKTDNDSTGFSSTLTGLKPATVYYIRAFAVNPADTAFGPVGRFSTSFSDGEGNVYETVAIGSRLWMKENLRTRTFADGTPIPEVSSSAWSSATGAACDWVQPDRILYGRFYNHAALAGSAGICPSGWKVPAQADWDTLFLESGGWQQAGIRMRAARSEWGPSIPADQGISGFQAFPTGQRSPEGNAVQPASFAWWWTGGTAPPYASVRISNLDPEAMRYTIPDPRTGLCIRCLKNR
jgi:uncharacterized protein (TIGR02145 family)